MTLTTTSHSGLRVRKVDNSSIMVHNQEQIYIHDVGLSVTTLGLYPNGVRSRDQLENSLIE